MPAPQTMHCQWAVMQITSQQKPLCHYTLICSQAGFQLVPHPWAIIHCQGLSRVHQLFSEQREGGKQSYGTDSPKEPALTTMIPARLRD